MGNKLQINIYIKNKKCLSSVNKKFDNDCTELLRDIDSDERKDVQEYYEHTKWCVSSSYNKLTNDISRLEGILPKLKQTIYSKNAIQYLEKIKSTKSHYILVRSIHRLFINIEFLKDELEIYEFYLDSLYLNCKFTNLRMKADCQQSTNCTIIIKIIK